MPCRPGHRKSDDGKHGFHVISPKIRTEFVVRREKVKERSVAALDRAWRVGHHGRDMIFYEEWVGDGCC